MKGAHRNIVRGPEMGGPQRDGQRCIRPKMTINRTAGQKATIPGEATRKHRKGIGRGAEAEHYSTDRGARKPGVRPGHMRIDMETNSWAEPERDSDTRSQRTCPTTQVKSPMD
ncbi:unnamed protein product [Calypogeia fissa]